MAKKKLTLAEAPTGRGQVRRFGSQLTPAARECFNSLAKRYNAGELPFNSVSALANFIHDLPIDNEYTDIHPEFMRAAKLINRKTFSAKFNEKCNEQKAK